MFLIFLLSSTPGEAINSAGLDNEILHINGHFLMFLLLSIMYFKATKKIFYAIFLTFLYGIFDEIHQVFTPMRSAGVFDVFVDTLGGILGGVIIWKGLSHLPNKLKSWLMN